MLYSKRRKNLGGGRRKRSNRKSFMSGGSLAYNYTPDFSTSHTTSQLDVNVLCNLIFKNTPIYSKQFKPFFNYTPPDQPHKGGFGPLNSSQEACINSTSTRGLSPLYTACRNHSDIILIKFLIEQAIDLHKLYGKSNSLGQLIGDQNTAAHAVSYSYCINNCDVLPDDSNVQQLHAIAEKNAIFARSVEDKFKILDLFKNRGFNFETQNIKENKTLGETVWDLIYEVETIKCKNRVNQYIAPDKPLHKYTTEDIRDSYLIPEGWMRQTDISTNKLYYINLATNKSQWDKPR